MNNKLEQFANSAFMKKIQQVSVKLSKSPAFGTISQGMGGTMGLIMIGAVVQIICAVGGLVFGWKAGQPNKKLMGSESRSLPHQSFALSQKERHLV